MPDKGIDSTIGEKFALESVPIENRQPWGSIALILAGALICVPALMVGGVLLSGLTVVKALLAGLIGYAIVVTYMCFQGIQSSDLGRPTVSVAGSAFGETGSRILISLVLGVATVGWFGVQSNICGSAFSGIMASWTGLNIPIWVSSLIWSLIMLATAIYGFNALKYLNYIAVPSLVILSIYATYISLSKYGTGVLSTYQPEKPFPLLHGIALAVGLFAVGGVLVGDYSRYARKRKDVILASAVGVMPIGIAMFTMGGIMAVVAGTYDITVILSKIGVPAIGLIILILATWTTNTINAYSGGLAVTNMFNLDDSKRAVTTAAAGALGTILAVAGIIDYFVDFLTLLTSAIPAVAGVMIADYWIIKKGKPEKWSKMAGINWAGVIAWLLGVLAANLVTFGIQPVNGIVTAVICYLILMKIIKKT